MALSIISKNGYRKAIVDEDAQGIFINYYRPIALGDLAAGWKFHRCARPDMPFYHATELAYLILNEAPPEIGARAR